MKLAQEYLIFVPADNSIYAPNECIKFFFIAFHFVTNWIVQAWEPSSAPSDVGVVHLSGHVNFVCKPLHRRKKRSINHQLLISIAISAQYKINIFGPDFYFARTARQFALKIHISKCPRATGVREQEPTSGQKPLK